MDEMRSEGSVVQVENEMMGGYGEVQIDTLLVLLQCLGGEERGFCCKRMRSDKGTCTGIVEYWGSLIDMIGELTIEEE